MNPTLRGFLIIALIAVAIVLLRLEATLVALLIVARIAFFLAIAFFIYLMWRERREEIGSGRCAPASSSTAPRLLAVADLGVNWYGGAHGLQVLAFVAVLVGCGFAMWRTWRDQHTLRVAASRARRATERAVERGERLADRHVLPDEDRRVAQRVRRRLAVAEAQHQVHEVGRLVALERRHELLVVDPERVASCGS